MKYITRTAQLVKQEGRYIPVRVTYMLNYEGHPKAKKITPYAIHNPLSKKYKGNA
jgi:hypothetical protein